MIILIFVIIIALLGARFIGFFILLPFRILIWWLIVPFRMVRAIRAPARKRKEDQLLADKIGAAVQAAIAADREQQNKLIDVRKAEWL